MQRMNPMKAVLFDFNGTLYNDTAFHLQAWQKYLKERFGFDLSAEEVHRRCIGPSNENIFKDFFGADISPEKIRKYSAEKEVAYRSVCRSDPKNLELMDGAAELFDLLIERRIPFCLATASPRENIEFYLEDLNLKKWMDIDSIVYEEGKLPVKPDPAFYIEAARRVGCTPDECIIVEDSKTGIEAAIRAKAGKLIVIDRTAPREYLENTPEIDALIHDFHGFEKFL